MYHDIIIKENFKEVFFQYLLDNHIPFEIVGYMDIGVAVSVQCFPSTAEIIYSIWNDMIVVPEVQL